MTHKPDGGREPPVTDQGKTMDVNEHGNKLPSEAKELSLQELEQYRDWLGSYDALMLSGLLQYNIPAVDAEIARRKDNG